MTSFWNEVSWKFCTNNTPPSLEVCRDAQGSQWIGCHIHITLFLNTKVTWRKTFAFFLYIRQLPTVFKPNIISNIINNEYFHCTTAFKPDLNKQTSYQSSYPTRLPLHVACLQPYEDQEGSDEKYEELTNTQRTWKNLRHIFRRTFRHIRIRIMASYVPH